MADFFYFYFFEIHTLLSCAHRNPARENKKKTYKYFEYCCSMLNSLFAILAISKPFCDFFLKIPNTMKKLKNEEPGK